MSATAEEVAVVGATEEPGVTSPHLEAVAVGVRAAGVIIALAYLTGLTRGPLLAAAGGLALATFGHALVQERRPSLLTGAAFAVLVLALAAGALRWATLELVDLRGVQAVLGPTVLMEKTGSAQPWLLPAAAWTAAGAAVLATGAWLRFPRGEAWFSLVPWGLELVVAGLAVGTVFWGPAATSFGAGDGGEIWADLGRWALVTLAVAVPAAGISYLLARFGRIWSIAVVSLAAAAALSAAGVTAAQVLS